MGWGVPQVPPIIQTWVGGTVLLGVPPTMQTWVGGTPSRPGQGGPMGYPHHPDLGGRGTPSSPGGGLPQVPSTIQTWSGMGVPQVPLHHPDLRWGTPTQTWDGVPPTQTWDGVLPPTVLGWGTPLPASVNRLKILPLPILQMQAVNINKEASVWLHAELFFFVVEEWVTKFKFVA